LKRIHNRIGFTLVELMVGIMFISIAGLSLSVMYANGRSIIEEQRHRRAVLERMQQQFERLGYLKKALGQIPTSESREFTDTLRISYDPDAPDVQTLDCDIRIIPSQELNPQGNNLYQQVEITYNWVELGSGQHYNLHMRTRY
jgi:type II secretory pathway pseudopilin PulG